MIKWIIQWYQNFTFHNIFSVQKSIHLKIIQLLIRCYKTRFFLWNTNNTDRNGVSKQHTHAHTHTHNYSSITYFHTNMKVIPSPFFKKPPHLFYQPLRFYVKNPTPPSTYTHTHTHPFFENFERMGSIYALSFSS